VQRFITDDKLFSSVALASDGATAHAVALNEAGQVIVQYTWNGDANLDGIVNFDDFTLFLEGYHPAPETINGASSVAALLGWRAGDFNYNGSVDFDDFARFLDGFYAYAMGEISL
jgi:hypothetical protein